MKASMFHGALLINPQAIQALGGLFEAASNDATSVRWAAGGKPRQQKQVAVLPIYGLIDKKRSWMMDFVGGTSTDIVGAVLDQLADDPQIKGIVLDVDSPGGSSVGTPVLARKIFEAREKKLIVAVSNSEMNSAAYWIGSAAHKVFVSPDSYTGSVGVWSAAAEYSKAIEEDGVKVHVWRSTQSPYKAEFLPWQEFTKDAVDHEQVEVDRIYDEFIEAVARQRGVSVAHAQKSFGQGRVMGAKAAVAAGLADRVATLDDVIRRMDSGRLTKSSMENLEEVFSAPDDSWKDINATERKRSELQRMGMLPGRRAMEMDMEEFKVGDRVKVKPGMQHDEEMEEEMIGTIQEISTPALGIMFDGDEEMHKWYVAHEVEKA